MSHAVRPLETGECDKAGEILAHAFHDDPGMRYVLPERERYERLAPWMFASWARWTILYGAAWTTPDLEGVALRRMPGQDRDNLWRYLRSGMIKTPRFLGKPAMERLQILTETLARKRPEVAGSKRYWYCWTIGVHPDKQGQGIGKALMQQTFSSAARDGLPCCLETFTEKDVAIHGSQGYELRDRLQIPDSDLTAYMMVRPAEPNPASH